MTDEQIAHHEGGHLAVAYLLNAVILGGSIEPGKRYAGVAMVHMRAVPTRDLDRISRAGVVGEPPTVRRHCEGKALICLAGSHAEKLAPPRIVAAGGYQAEVSLEKPEQRPAASLPPQHRLTGADKVMFAESRADDSDDDWKNDLVMAYDAVELLLRGTGKRIQLYMEFLDLEVRELLEEERVKRLVRAAAEELLLHRTISGPRVRAVMKANDTWKRRK
ncbi:MAG: hypothetical protein ACRDL2_10740 [Gaiellaceae bacterium]